MGVFAGTERQCTEDEHDDEDENDSQYSMLSPQPNDGSRGSASDISIYLSLQVNRYRSGIGFPWALVRHGTITSDFSLLKDSSIARFRLSAGSS